MPRVKLVYRVEKAETEVHNSGPFLAERRPGWPGLDGVCEPSVDLYEKRDEFVVEVELPGLTEKEVRVLLYPNRVEVKGVKKARLPREAFSFLRMEREFGPFQREVVIPGEVDPDRAVAFMEKGVLTIVLKKPAGKRAK